MKKLLPLLSLLGLAGIILPPIVYLAGSCEKSTMSAFMLAGTLAWFGTVPFWMGRSEAGEP